MYEIVFYRDKNGISEIENFLDELKANSRNDKNARVNWQKILGYMTALEEKGVLIGEPYVKHLEGELYELRPIKNRIIFFYWKDAQYVMLCHFIKRTRKTPKREIEKAERLMNDWLERNANETS